MAVTPSSLLSLSRGTSSAAALAVPLKLLNSFTACLLLGMSLSHCHKATSRSYYLNNVGSPSNIGAGSLSLCALLAAPAPDDIDDVVAIVPSCSIATALHNRSSAATVGGNGLHPTKQNGLSPTSGHLKAQLRFSPGMRPLSLCGFQEQI